MNQYLFGTDAQNSYKTMFCHLYHPVSSYPDSQLQFVPLNQLLHWQHRMKRWHIEDKKINQQNGCIPKGYFYSIHTPLPQIDEIAQILKAHQGVTLIPNIRVGSPSNGKDSLDDAGFLRLPWSLEAIYQMRDGLDLDLRAQLGKKRHKEIKRLVRNAENEYEFLIFLGSQAHTEEVLNTFSKLHEFNALKYHHGLNTYSREILDALVSSSLGGQMLIGMQKDRQNGQIVQSSLSLVSFDTQEMVQLAQGIDHHQVPPTQNLYVAETYQLYRWGNDHGITRFNLGRDSPLIKRALGANEFYPLENRIHVHDTAFIPDILQIQEIAEKYFREEVGLLEEKNFVNNIVLSENCLKFMG